MQSQSPLHDMSGVLFCRAMRPAQDHFMVAALCITSSTSICLLSVCDLEGWCPGSFNSSLCCSEFIDTPANEGNLHKPYVRTGRWFKYLFPRSSSCWTGGYFENTQLRGLKINGRNLKRHLCFVYFERNAELETGLNEPSKSKRHFRNTFLM